jgi:hypothetical protein
MLRKYVNIHGNHVWTWQPLEDARALSLGVQEKMSSKKIKQKWNAKYKN